MRADDQTAQGRLRRRFRIPILLRAADVVRVEPRDPSERGSIVHTSTVTETICVTEVVGEIDAMIAQEEGLRGHVRE